MTTQTPSISPKPTVLVTLVHGTWAHGLLRSSPGKSRSWFDENETFSRSLRNLLERRGVNVVFLPPCIWSGGNSLRARRSCAKAIIESQRAAIKLDASATRIVVAHSHGGTAAMRAISGMPMRLVPHSLITMATPFIVTEKRIVPRGERWAIEGASVAGNVMGMIGALFVIAYTLKLFIPDSIVEANKAFIDANEIILNVVFVILVMLAVTAALKIVRKISRVRGRLVRLAHNMNPTKISACKILVLRAPGDEASLALGVGDTVEWAHSLVRTVFAIPARVARSWLENRIIGTIANAVFNVVLVTGALTALYSVFISEWIEGSHPMGVVVTIFMTGTIAVLTPVAIGFAAFLLTGLVASVSMLLSSLLSFGHGIEYPLLGWSSRTTAESSPLGLRVATQSLRVRFRSGLRHGIYRHAACRRAVADWIEEVIKSRKLHS